MQLLEWDSPIYIMYTEAEFKKFKPRRWTVDNRFKLSAGSNLGTLSTISRGTNLWLPKMDETLKGVFAKNERGYRLTTKNKRFCCVYKEKIVKNVPSIQIQKVATFNSDRKKNHFNYKQIIQILQQIIIDYFSTHSYLVNISWYFLFVLYIMHLKRQNNWPPGVSALNALNDYTWQRHLAEKKVF